VYPNVTEIVAEARLQGFARQIRKRLSLGRQYILHDRWRLRTSIAAGRKPLQRKPFHPAIRTLPF
jgi:hypothetical protein